MDTGRPTIGVVAISYQEETDLPGFLENLLPWVDEIVLVDDGSTDDTRRIARSAGERVRFVVAPRADNEYFADQRNKGITLARSDWLLHMDVDERVPADLMAEILRAIGNPEFDAYRYRRVNYFLNRPMKGGGLADWNQVHLARRACLRFSGRYHESVHISAPDGRIGQLEARMLHLNDATFAERLRKSDAYQFEIAERIRTSGRRVRYRDLLFAVPMEFLFKYLWKRGFADGVPGLIWAVHAATARFRAFALVWDEQNRVGRGELEIDLPGPEKPNPAEE